MNWILLHRETCMEERILTKVKNHHKAFADHVSDKGLVCRIYNKMLTSPNQNGKHPNRMKPSKGFSRDFSREDIQIHES